MKGLLGLALFTLGCLVCRAEDESARLLASKSILNQMLIEDKDVTVEYNLFNVGGSSAFNVDLKDDSFPASDFEVVSGSLNTHWARIGANNNVTHVVILKPLRSGYFNFTAAEVTYSPQEGSSERQFGYTSAPGEGGIMSHKEYDRRFSPHFVDWAAFAVMTLPSLGIPFLLWFNSKSKYESEPKSKKN